MVHTKIQRYQRSGDRVRDAGCDPEPDFQLFQTLVAVLAEFGRQGRRQERVW
jgi:hypothetical protein